ncbi:hypothetical protein F5X99DRAFT_426528 [Biscogniauxia marginata]|nr:hypothetical protein F5X99DRAFT_426528 [Biscogniauxia marginata]
MADQSTMCDGLVVAGNGERRQMSGLSSDAYFCRILRQSASILRMGPEGFIDPDDDDEDEDEDGVYIIGPHNGWVAVEGISSSSDDQANGLVLRDSDENDKLDSQTSPSLIGNGLITNSYEELEALCERLKFLQIMKLLNDTPHIHVELEADEILRQHQIQTPTGSVTLKKNLVEEAEDDADEGGLIVNRDGMYPRSELDPESFKNDFFEVKKSPLGGLGAFARVDIKARETILVERELLVANQTTIYDAVDELTPAQRKAFFRLHTFIRTPNDLFDGKRYATFRTNSFGIPSAPDDSSALFLVASRFNHACRPRSNVGYGYDRAKRCMALATRRAVPAGEELTIAYSRSPAELYAVWGFRCTCGACEPLSDAACEAAWGPGTKRA